MVVHGVNRRDAGSPIDDIAYLTRSEHRVTTLVALTNHPRSRSELCEVTGVSASTMRRTLRRFENRNWVRKDGHRYEATQLGTVVASGMGDLIERFETERRVRDVWHWLPGPLTEFTVETWSALTVTVAEPDSPYRPVNRFESLLRETNSFHSLRPEVALMEPCLDALWNLVESGGDVTLIDRPSCHEYFFSTYPKRSSEMVSRDNFTVLEHDDLPPYGLGILDDRVYVSCYETDSGTVQAVIDTDAQAVREWAESVYASFDAEARLPASVSIVD